MKNWTSKMKFWSKFTLNNTEIKSQTKKVTVIIKFKYRNKRTHLRFVTEWWGEFLFNAKSNQFIAWESTCFQYQIDWLKSTTEKYSFKGYKNEMLFFGVLMVDAIVAVCNFLSNHQQPFKTGNCSKFPAALFYYISR